MNHTQPSPQFLQLTASKRQHLAKALAIDQDLSQAYCGLTRQLASLIQKHEFLHRQNMDQTIEMKKRLNNAEANFSSLQAQFTASIKQQAELERQLATIHNSKLSLVSQIDELKNQLLLWQSKYSEEVEKSKQQKIKIEDSHRSQLQICLERQKSEMNSELMKATSTLRSELERLHSTELSQLNEQNKAQLSAVQSEYARKEFQRNFSAKAADQSSQKALQTNTKLVQISNELKARLMKLQVQLEEERQSHRMAQRLFQSKIEAQRRQTAFHKDGEESATAKIKNLQQKLQQSIWESKELTQNYQQRLRTVRQTIEIEIQQTLQGRMRQLETELRQRQTELYDAQRQLTSVTILSKEAKGEVSLLTTQLLSLRDELAKEKANRELLQAHNNTLSEQLSQSRNIELIEKLKKENLLKVAESETLTEEVNRLKAKCNKLTAAYKQISKDRQTILEENKILMEEVVALRGANQRPSQKHVLSIESDESVIEANELEEYKNAIRELSDGMQEALAKINEKERVIQQQASMIAKMESFITHKR